RRVERARPPSSRSGARACRRDRRVMRRASPRLRARADRIRRIHRRSRTRGPESASLQRVPQTRTGTKPRNRETTNETVIVEWHLESVGNRALQYLVQMEVMLAEFP